MLDTFTIIETIIFDSECLIILNYTHDESNLYTIEWTMLENDTSMII